MSSQYFLCPRCKTQVFVGNNFCGNCALQFGIPQNYQQQFNHFASKKKNSLIGLWVTIGIIGFCALCGIFGRLSNTDRPKQTVSIAQTEHTKPVSLKSSSTPATSAPESKKEFTEISSNKKATIISENANLRKTPEMSSEILEVVPKGEEIAVIKQKGAWFQIQYNEQTGWLHGNTFRLHEQPISTPKTETYEPPPVRAKPFKSSSSDSYYIRGPRGGCYYINRNGNKTYVDRSMCN